VCDSIPVHASLVLRLLLLLPLPAGGRDRLSSTRIRKETASAESLAVFFWVLPNDDDHDPDRQLPRTGFRGPNLVHRRRTHREHRAAAAARTPDPVLPDPGHPGRAADRRDAAPGARHPARALGPAARRHRAVLDP